MDDSKDTGSSSEQGRKSASSVNPKWYFETYGTELVCSSDWVMYVRLFSYNLITYLILHLFIPYCHV